MTAKALEDHHLAAGYTARAHRLTSPTLHRICSNVHVLGNGKLVDAQQVPIRRTWPSYGFLLLSWQGNRPVSLQCRDSSGVLANSKYGLEPTATSNSYIQRNVRLPTFDIFSSCPPRRYWVFTFHRRTHGTSTFRIAISRVCIGCKTAMKFKVAVKR